MPRFKLIAIDGEGRIDKSKTRRSTSEKFIKKKKKEQEARHPELEFRIMK